MRHQFASTRGTILLLISRSAARRLRQDRPRSQHGRRTAAQDRPGCRAGSRQRHDPQHQPGGRRRNRPSTPRRSRGSSTRASRPSSRPQAVVVVDSRNWPAALAASSLAGAPLSAPILFAEGNTLPAASLQALEAMQPDRSERAGRRAGHQDRHRSPDAQSATRVRSLPSASAAGTIAEIGRLLAQADGAAPPPGDRAGRRRRRAALQMPAAGLSAESGAPILFAAPARRCRPRRSSALRALRRPSIYVMNAASLSRAALGELARLGRVIRIPEAGSGEAPGPASGAIAVARFTDGVLRLGRQRARPRPRLRQLDPATGRPCGGPALGDAATTARCCCSKRPTGSRRSSRPTSATSSRPTPPRPNSSPSAGSTITAG